MLDKKPLPLFQQQQYALAAHLRNPDNVLPPKGVEARRIGIYRDLLLNNMSGFIDNAFPVLNQLYNPARWQQLIRLFLATHHYK